MFLFHHIPHSLIFILSLYNYNSSFDPLEIFILSTLYSVLEKNSKIDKLLLNSIFLIFRYEKPNDFLGLLNLSIGNLLDMYHHTNYDGNFINTVFKFVNFFSDVNSIFCLFLLITIHIVAHLYNFSINKKRKIIPWCYLFKSFLKITRVANYFSTKII